MSVNGRTTLLLEVNGLEYAICSLVTDKVENQPLHILLTEEDEATIRVSGVNPISLTGTVELDQDFIPDEDEEDSHGSLQFRDPSDNTFLGGFELRHFGLAQQNSSFDKVDLRKEETSLEDGALNDRIVLGLINSMKNSGDKSKLGMAKVLTGRLNQSIAERKNKKVLK
ncbi:hypothetical protein CLU79DRAFT_833992 [Phycomyces nitens]|nr:hypothetical protein CLU79DRAFT_833992 [Phycomyces nitens]